MEKQKKQLLIAVIALLILVVGYFAFQAWQKKQPTAESEVKTYEVMNVKTEEVNAISYQSADFQYRFEKEGDAWKCQEDSSLSIDPIQIEALITSITNMLSTQKIEGNSNLEEYGLGTPQKTITIVTDAGEKTVYFGDKNEMTGQYYMKLAKEDTIYMAEERVILMFEKPATDFVKVEPVTEDTSIEDTTTEEAIAE